MARVQVTGWTFSPATRSIALGVAIPLSWLTAIRDLTTGDTLYLAEDFYEAPPVMVGETLTFQSPFPAECAPEDELDIWYESTGPIPFDPYGYYSVYAPVDGPIFQGTVSVPRLLITGGSPQPGEVLTSTDIFGNASWEPPAAGGLATPTTPGSIQLAGDIAGPATAPTVPGKANVASPTFTGIVSAPQIRATTSVTTPQLAVTGGTLAGGQVLTSDPFGNASWQPPAPAEGFTFVQSTPSAQWVVNHTLGRDPLSVTVTQGTSVVMPDVTYSSSSQVVINLPSPQTGTVYLV